MLTAESGITYGIETKRQTRAANPAITEAASLTRCHTDVIYGPYPLVREHLPVGRFE